MKLRISAVQVLICCAFVTPTTLLAQSRPVWTLGIAAIGDTSPTQKAETTSDLTPFVQLEWGQLTLDLSSISYQIVETSVFVAVASLNYAPGPEIEGVRRRDFVDLSIGGTFLGETLRHSAVLSTDITDTNAGSLLELSTSSDLGGVSLSAGARVRDDQRTAFIFGAEGKVTVSPFITISSTIPLSEETFVLLGAEYEMFDDQIKNSPSVYDPHAVNLIMMLGYQF